RYRDTLALPSFPTRRSSDLDEFLSQLLIADRFGHVVGDQHQPLRLGRRGEGAGGDFQIAPADRAYLKHAALAPVQYFAGGTEDRDRKSTRLNSSHLVISYAV